MRRFILIPVLCCAMMAIAACGYLRAPTSSKSRLPAAATVVLNGTVIDGTGVAPIPNGLVAIENGVLVAVGREDGFEIPATARILDAQGGTILPGFIDAHTHLLMGNADSLHIRLSHWLRTGVTTLRDMGSHYGIAGDIGELRKQLRSYGHSVPTVVLAGPFITAPGGVPMSFHPDKTLTAADEKEAEQAATQALDAGADFLKIFVEKGPLANPLPTLTGSQVATIVGVAHERGTWVSVHTTHPDDAWTAVVNGVDDLAHPPAGEVSGELLGQMIARDVLLGTTLVTYDGWFLHDYIGFSAAELALVQQQRREYGRRFLDAGGRFALSTDSPYAYGMPPGMPVMELERMVDMGMTPMEVIVAATRNGAQACGLGDQAGTLERGKQADLIVAAGDPLQDIRAVADVSIVIKRGAVVVHP